MFFLYIELITCFKIVVLLNVKKVFIEKKKENLLSEICFSDYHLQDNLLLGQLI